MMSAREGGRAMCPTSPTLYNSKFWKGDDKRRNLVLYRASDDYYFCDKYQNPQTREEYAPILRYAEVLLNEAEAAARAGGQDSRIGEIESSKRPFFGRPRYTDV